MMPLHWRGLHVFHQLLQHLAPPLREAHLFVGRGVVLVSMHGAPRIFATAFAVRFEREDRGEEPRGLRWVERAIAGPQRGGPNQLAVRDNLQITTRVRR